MSLNSPKEAVIAFVKNLNELNIEELVKNSDLSDENKEKVILKSKSIVENKVLIKGIKSLYTIKINEIVNEEINSDKAVVKVNWSAQYPQELLRMIEDFQKTGKVKEITMSVVAGLVFAKKIKFSGDVKIYLELVDDVWVIDSDKYIRG